MQIEERTQVKKLILDHIKYEQFVHTDKNGDMRIGIGHELQNRGVSLSAALYLLDEDIPYQESKLVTYMPFYREFTWPRKMVLLTLAQMWGFQNLLARTDLKLALEAHDYMRAGHILRADKQERLAHILEVNDF